MKNNTLEQLEARHSEIYKLKLQGVHSKGMAVELVNIRDQINAIKEQEKDSVKDILDT